MDEFVGDFVVLCFLQNGFVHFTVEVHFYNMCIRREDDWLEGTLICLEVDLFLSSIDYAWYKAFFPDRFCVNFPYVRTWRTA
ncbi:hypothetical protein NK983_30710, partial [Salmonella enterica subsp. enterica serovar Typhimurium]|nr:hypothetical protein [Salmonella enterica subsp. enterica serovar Typhimurium]